MWTGRSRSARRRWRLPRGHPNYLSSLGVALQRRSERTGRLEDLDRAIIVAHEAVEAAPRATPAGPATCPTWGPPCLPGFGRTGRVEDLDRAIALAQDAVWKPHQEPPNRATYLSASGSLDRRFDRTAMLEDLDRAIALAQEAVQATPQVRRTGPDS